MNEYNKQDCQCVTIAWKADAVSNPHFHGDYVVNFMGIRRLLCLNYTVITQSRSVVSGAGRTAAVPRAGTAGLKLLLA